MINGVGLIVKVDQLKLGIPSVCDAHRLVRLRPGVERNTEGTLSVLLSFDAERLPDKDMLGFLSYPVRAFVLNPLRCFRCHVYVHVAVLCRREIPRFEKCFH